MTELSELFERRFARPTPIINAEVVSAPVDTRTGRSIGYVTVQVQGQSSFRVPVNPDDPLYAPGDRLVLHQFGTPSNADYIISSRTSGDRPVIIRQQFTTTASIGGVVYEPGDIVTGVPGTGSFPGTATEAGTSRTIEARTGNTYYRVGASIVGVDYANGDRLFGAGTCNITTGCVTAASDRSNILITSGCVLLRSGSIPTIVLDSSGSAYIERDLQMGTLGKIRSVATDFMTGNGYWLDYNSGSPRFRVGTVSSGSILRGVAWDGTALTFKSASTSLAYNGSFTTTSACITGSINAVSGCIGNLVVTGSISSPNYSPGASGWMISSTGNAYLNSACLSGSINAVSGCLGTLVVTGSLGSGNFQSGISGWQIDTSGCAEFNNVTVRGTIKTVVFEKSLVTAIAGTQMVSKSAGVLTASTTAASTVFSITVGQQAGGAPFESGDVVRFSDGINTTWAIVSTGSVSASSYIFTASYQYGACTQSYQAGQTLVDYGPSGSGYIINTADATNAPHVSIQTHTGSPWLTTTEYVRIGNMKGAFGTGTDNHWGLGVGDYSASNYLTYNNAHGFEMKAGGGGVIIDSTGGLSFQAASGAYTSREITFLGLTPGTYLSRIGSFLGEGTGANRLEIEANSKTGADTALVVAAGGPNSQNIYCGMAVVQGGGPPGGAAWLEISASGNVSFNANSDTFLTKGLNVGSALGATEGQIRTSGCMSLNTGGTPLAALHVHGGLALEGGGHSIDTAVVGKGVFLQGALYSGSTGFYANGQVGLGMWWDGTNYRTATDGGSNGAAMIAGLASGEKLSLFTVPSTGSSQQTIAASTLLANNQRITILGTGEVGIGTATPAAKLAINGGVHVGGTTDPGDNNLLVDGTITKGSTLVTTFVPQEPPLTSTAWDGDVKDSATKAVIDLSAVFGAPAGIKAVLLQVAWKEEQGDFDGYIIFSPVNTTGLGVRVGPGRGTSLWQYGQVIVPCDANGDIYYQTVTYSATSLAVDVKIVGYWI